ncbi:MAG: peptide MFS transporter [Flavobacteriaceae bacterium]|jgi:proton-dependent oligopeptide transporter, POT family|nr:peptide MFS transporter [Flavobacteriaceae bacterium]MDP4674601.1 peptide MFS transporter [Flavobacteriaceae bacterium]MDP4755127.1 peptide MFS transporter [Flavobacteriaceae bacterium]MDP4794858.1 peptide MFS transporter [Flavobacteriaceae bacterium]MDP4885946.1 peptide MFS transporter [Flavobacteriaceae bacterium]
MSTTAIPVHERQLFGHPTGLYILFFTEMWERFSYYGMRALFVLFLVAETTSSNAGFGWTNEEALALYGTYTMLVYLASVPGGWVADRLLGQRKTVMLGGALLCIGHAVLAFNSEIAFYIGCLFIILGVGGLKPNISSMVGGLYKPKDERRDIGFYIFYMGINIGGFLAPILCGYIGEKYNWHYGFGLAAIGMLLGQGVYLWGQKYLVHVGNKMSVKNEADRVLLERPLTKIEKDRVKVLLISFLLIILFWAAFEQAGGLMNLYASQKTDRNFFGLFEIPASVFQSVNSFFIITLATAVGAFWVRWKKKGKEASSIFKIALGLVIMALGFGFMAAASAQYAQEGSSAMYWVILAFLFHTVGELCASPVSLSYITKLAPLKYASIIMGLYWAATGLGNKVAGKIGELSQSLGEFEIFLGIAIVWSIIGLLVIAVLKPLKRLSHGAEDGEVAM